jgi:hypothetical protein
MISKLNEIPKCFNNKKVKVAIVLVFPSLNG